MAAIPDRDAEGDGAWGDLLDWPLVAIHSIVLPDGKVLSFGTDERGKQGGEFIYDVWDPVTGLHRTIPNTVAVDLFCSNMAIVPATGEVLIFGGDKRGEDGPVGEGVSDVTVFDYRTMGLSDSSLGDMAHERWYGTVVTLSTGELLVMGGRSEGFSGSAIPEIYDPETGFRALPGAAIADFAGENANLNNSWWYPHAWQRSDGMVVVIESYDDDIYLMDVAGQGAVQKVGDLPFASHKLDAAVMFDVDRVLMLGVDGDLWVGDLAGAVPGFSQVGQLAQGRINAGMTLLADGTVVITGGSETGSAVRGQGSGAADLDRAALDAVLWDPRDLSITTLAAQDMARLYHSSALLLPDGTVLSAGGGAPGPLTNLDAQVFAPPNLYTASGWAVSRPAIAQAPSNIDSGATFRLSVSDAYDVATVGAIRSGAMTHARNTDARYLSLEFRVLDGTTLEVAAPGANVMIPGLWMISTVDGSGTPSEAALIGVDMAPLVETPAITEITPILYDNEVRQISGATEIALTARWDDLDHGQWQTAFDFSNGPGADNVLMGQLADTSDMFFEIWTDGSANRLVAEGAIIEGQVADWAAQVLPDGTMRILKNDVVLAETLGVLPPPLEREFAYFGRSSWPDDAQLSGLVRGLEVRDLIGQSGAVAITQSGPNQWHRVDFAVAMEAPVVVAGPVTLNGSDPVHVRLRDVTAEGFEFQFEEWAYLDGWHTAETVQWMAVEAGVHVLGDGAVIEAGVTTADHTRTSVDFSDAFGDAAPVVVAQVASERGGHEVVHRLDGVSAEGFGLRLQEEEGRDGRHVLEDVGWIAFESGVHADFSAAADIRVDERPAALPAAATAGHVLLADMQTLRGTDPASLRLDTGASGEATLTVHEERSRDSESDHVLERVGWVAAEEWLFA